jgi:long-subunit fatty acid transport protein
MRIRYFVFTALSLIIAASAVRAEISGARYLLVPPGSRPNSMGQAFTAVADDSNAIYWNPAGLAFLSKREISFTHTKGLVSTNLDYLTFVQPVQSNGSGFGASLFFLSDTQWRTDEQGNFLGQFDNTALTALVSYAKKISSGLGAGVNLKILQQSLDSHQANALALDAGALYKDLLPRLDIGLAVQNAGTKMKFINDEFSLPLMVNLGAAYRPSEKLILDVDVDDYIVDQNVGINAGGEYLISSMFALRAGYQYHPDFVADRLFGGLSMGIGFGTEGFSIDYAFVPYGEIGDMHKLSFSFKF